MGKLSGKRQWLLLTKEIHVEERERERESDSVYKLILIQNQEDRAGNGN